MADDDVVILNNIATGPTRRESSTGRVRYTVDVKSEPLIHNFNAKQLAEGPALAIALLLREKVQAIGAVPSVATQRARVVAAKAYNAGAAWTRKQYAGGKTGGLPPNQSNRVGTDSGRFAKSISAGAVSDGWVVNVAANRLDPTTLNGGEAGLQRWWTQLNQYVPEFANTRLLFENEKVTNAVQQSLESLIVKAKETRDQLTQARAQAALRVASQFLQALRQALAA